MEELINIKNRNIGGIKKVKATENYFYIFRKCSYIKKQYFIYASLILFCFIANQLNAQSYITSLGLRAGTEIGITIQQRLFKRNTLELILETNRYRWCTTALIENHNRFIGKRVNFYTGAGGHYGEERAYGKYYGVTPIVGIEATIAGLTISWDYKPSINLFGGSTYVFHDSGLSIRHVIIKQPKKHFFKNLFKKKKSKNS